MNINRPYGLAPVADLSASPWSGSGNKYYIQQSDTNAYFIGDIVVSSPGSLNGRLNDQVLVGVPLCTKAIAGNAPRGVIIGIDGDTSFPNRFSIPAVKTRGYTVLVVDDSRAVFTVQADASAPIAETLVNLYADFVVNAPQTNAGSSATVVNAATISSSAALPFRILGLASGEYGLYANLLVAFNLHELA